MSYGGKGKTKGGRNKTKAYIGDFNFVLSPLSIHVSALLLTAFTGGGGENRVISNRWIYSPLPPSHLSPKPDQSK